MDKLTAKGRLLKLAAFLETVPEENFDMQSVWTGEQEDRFACGSTACALGWCTVLFPKNFQICSYHRLGDSSGNSLWCFGYYVQDFFGITQPEAIDLFGGTEQRTAKEEAEVIREFCRGR